ncbi:hypothetical protein JTE90_006960 [Oedothorax gibbosus]|uniref:Protein kinase domain-containing protein n=1 Tax=Oedothorax gibbosus TaxID=931172 RepID=A0AAV6U4C0_9ARAC|nr:hypothetical protein JTE90_006960 [Oedothorax gibbosus]
MQNADFCDLNPEICGMEAGCHITKDGYVCICPDLKPTVNYSCDRTEKLKPPSSSTHPSVTEVPKPIAPTDGAFGSDQLRGMLSTTRQTPANFTDTNSTHPDNAPISQTPLVESQSPSSVVVACLLAVLFVFFASVAVLVYKRHKGDLLWWAPRRRGRNSAMSLSKCMQQYVANPNYYSNSPDAAPLLRSLQGLKHIPQESLALLEEIGEGCFGKVHKGLYTDSSGETVTVAVKTLKDNFNQDAQTDFEREVEIMSSFSHENILKLEGIVVQDNQTTPWMVFEFMQYGDLAQLLRNSSPFLRTENSHRSFHLSQFDLTWISSQIASGMVYLSSQHFVHRDLATRNCLVGENLSVKISDFGMSRDIYTSDYYKVGGSRMLPIRWMAPESITYGKFSLESDVWAYGVVLWEIFTYGKQPYYGHSNDEVVKLILQGILLSSPEHCPPFICNIMAGCWKTEPKDRLTFAEVFDFLSPHTPDRRRATPSQEDSTDFQVDSDNYLLPTSVTVV